MATRSTRRPYHHGNLRDALLAKAAIELRRRGYERLSIRDLAGAERVSGAAPYRHFANRRALLTALAARGFRDLLARMKAAAARQRTATGAVTSTGRVYLDFARKEPELFRLMFVSDLLRAPGPRERELVEVADAHFEWFRALVARACAGGDDKTVATTVLTVWSTVHGFALMRMGDRIKPFMRGGLSDTELSEAVIRAVAAIPALAHAREQAGARQSDGRLHEAV